MIEFGAAAAPLVRAYAALVWGVRDRAAACWNLAAAWLSALSRGAVELRRVQRTAAGRADIGRAVRTLVRVHGCQLLLDGVYNADPHPGNVILMDDGRLGLIDYGMVGRVNLEARATISRVVLALARGSKAEVHALYTEGGYRACWHGGKPHGVDAVHRIACFHLDRIDLSPVDIGGGERMDVLTMLRSTLEHAVPDWVEQGRRLGGLLIGVGSQAARPISLSREWAPIAEEVLRAEADGGGGGGARPASRRLKRHVTGDTSVTGGTA